MRLRPPVSKYDIDYQRDIVREIEREDFLNVKRDRSTTFVDDAFVAAKIYDNGGALTNVRHPRYGAKGDGATDDRAAIAAADATTGTLTIPAGTYRVGSTLTISSPVVFAEGAVIRPASGVTVTVNGTVYAGRHQWIDESDSGTVTIGKGACHYALPEWRGGVGDDSTDCTAAIRRSIEGFEGRAILIGPNIYRSSALNLTVSGPIHIAGVGHHSVIRMVGTGNLIENADPGSSSFSQWFRIENLRLVAESGASTKNNRGLYLNRLQFPAEIRNVVVTNFGMDGIVLDACSQVLMENVWVLSCNQSLDGAGSAGTASVYLVGGATASEGRNGATLINCGFEKPGNSKAGLTIDTFGHVSLLNCRHESDTDVLAVNLLSADGVTIDNLIVVQLASLARTTAIAIDASSAGIEIRNAKRINQGGASLGTWIDDNLLGTDVGDSDRVAYYNSDRPSGGGVATVADATTSVAVTHGLGVTPSIQDINVTPTNNLGSAAKFWISGPTSTQFTINVDADPGATTATFAWIASVQ